MWRVALFYSVVTLIIACGEGPNAPNASTDRLPRLQEGDPPPPPLDDGFGNVSLAPSEGDVEATEIGTQQECVPPAFEIPIEGEYFQNKSENQAHIRFRPVQEDPVDFASGAGTVHETARDPDQKAAGTLVALGTDGQQYQIHLRDYSGTTLFAFTEGSFFGGTSGALVAEVTACGEPIAYTGNLTFSWFCDECKDNF